MKTLTLSKLTFVLALILGLAAAWAVATPVSTDGIYAIRGGAGCCTGTDPDECPGSCSGQLVFCTWGPEGKPRCVYGTAHPCSGDGCDVYHDARYCGS